MADAKDILGIPKTGFLVPQENEPRPPKDSQRRPDGVPREFYALTGGLPPLIPTIDISHLKRRTQPDKDKITWQCLPFTSSARTDNLQLFHWVKVVNGVPPTGDYAFAKYNQHDDIVRYTDEEYEKYLTDPQILCPELVEPIHNMLISAWNLGDAKNWTKEETDQLFDLCEQFDLRFIVIADRFSTSRSAEELKNRYYSVSEALLIAKAPNSSDVSGHPLVKDAYNAHQEVERKHALPTVLPRMKHQSRKSDELTEARKTDSRINSKGVEESAAPANSDVGDGAIEKASVTVDSSNLQPFIASSTAYDANFPLPVGLRMLRVYLRSFAFEQIVQEANFPAGLRTIKRVEQTFQDLGVNVKPKVHTRAVCTEHLELRKEILLLLNLQKQLQYKEAEASASRDSQYGDVATPSTPKRSYRGGDPLYQQELGFTGERLDKRKHKRKALGRYSDGPPSPPQLKRARKLKASDM